MRARWTHGQVGVSGARIGGREGEIVPAHGRHVVLFLLLFGRQLVVSTFCRWRGRARQSSFRGRSVRPVGVSVVGVSWARACVRRAARHAQRSLDRAMTCERKCPDTSAQQPLQRRSALFPCSARRPALPPLSDCALSVSMKHSTSCKSPLVSTSRGSAAPELRPQSSQNRTECLPRQSHRLRVRNMSTSSAPPST
ncbi:hypothetical protein BD309DRAFT_153543 [Dichomitus squalens]|nr:hypothetical protein BD309DRAFT_153543 [Dichomitus squalens]